MSRTENLKALADHPIYGPIWEGLNKEQQIFCYNLIELAAVHDNDEYIRIIDRLFPPDYHWTNTNAIREILLAARE